MNWRIVFSNKMIVGVIVTSIILFSLSLETKTVTSPSNSLQIMKTNDQVAENPISFDLTPHDPIEIDSDSDFITYGFPGLGTAEDPYIIEGYNITTTHDKGIYISDTTKYFIIRNCYVDAEGYGISISSVDDGTATIINNTCNNNLYIGITLGGSGSSTVVNNTCNSNGNGILLGDSGSSTVVNNTCNSNGNGIFLGDSGSSTVANNTCNNNYRYGIRLSFSGSSTVANNTCNSNGKGIWIQSSGSSTVANNTCNNNNDEDGILLVGGSSSSTVANNTCNNNYRSGIWIQSSGSSTVINNTCENNNGKGIWLYSSGSSTVTNNTCSNNNYGIDLFSSSYCVVIYNLLQENERYGVYLDSVSNNNLIHHNTFVDNNFGGSYEGSSQAYDSGKKNTWYDPKTKEGNYWSDLGSECAYKIDGKAHSKDLYPLNRAQSCPNPITMTILSIVLPLLVSVAILAFVVPKYGIPYTRKTIIPYFRKRKSERQDRIAKLLSCSNCGEKVKLSLTFCDKCGTTLPKRKIIKLSEQELKSKLIINISLLIVIIVLLVVSFFGIFFGAFLGILFALWGEGGGFIALAIFCIILIIVLSFLLGRYIIPSLIRVIKEKRRRRNSGE